MADTKITALGTTPTLLTTDLLAVVSDPGGSPVTVKATISQVLGVGGGGGGAFQLLEQYTASASASLDFTTGITSTYDDYRVEILGLLPTVNGGSLSCLMSGNGGASWIAANYKRTVQLFSTNGSTSFVNDGGAAFDLGGTVVTGSQGFNGSLTLPRPAAAVSKCLFYESSWKHSSDSAYYGLVGHLFLIDATPINALRFIFDNGTIASGTIRLYGLAK